MQEKKFREEGEIFSQINIASKLSTAAGLVSISVHCMYSEVLDLCESIAKMKKEALLAGPTVIARGTGTR